MQREMTSRKLMVNHMRERLQSVANTRYVCTQNCSSLNDTIFLTKMHRTFLSDLFIITTRMLSPTRLLELSLTFVNCFVIQECNRLQLSNIVLTVHTKYAFYLLLCCGQRSKSWQLTFHANWTFVACTFVEIYTGDFCYTKWPSVDSFAHKQGCQHPLAHPKINIRNPNF